LRHAESVGRPLGSDVFIEKLEAETRRVLRPRPRASKPAAEPDDRQMELSALSP
jgi:hypothetical protein